MEMVDLSATRTGHHSIACFERDIAGGASDVRVVLGLKSPYTFLDGIRHANTFSQIEPIIKFVQCQHITGYKAKQADTIRRLSTGFGRFASDIHSLHAHIAPSAYRGASKRIYDGKHYREHE
jgi:hypothetical protein